MNEDIITTISKLMSFLLQDEGSTTGRTARVGRSSRQDLHSHL